MNYNNKFEITWKRINRSTFMYGANVKFSKGSVTISNALMPSGIVLHAWTMLSNFFDNASVPSLPILKKGNHYRFQFDYDVRPVNSIYFKITFYKKMAK